MGFRPDHVRKLYTHITRTWFTETYPCLKGGAGLIKQFAYDQEYQDAQQQNYRPTSLRAHCLTPVVHAEFS